MPSRRTHFDFSALHAAMQRLVDQSILPGVSMAVLVDGEVVDRHVAGFADLEAGVPLREDHLFRAFSNTKLVTSLALLQLLDGGQVRLDDPVARFLPAFADMRVLQPGARSLDDTVPARQPMTLRHLLSHSAGLSHGVFDPGTLLFEGYRERQVQSPKHTLATAMDLLATLPLLFEPGTGWTYSIAPDVVARIVEVVSGRPFDEQLRQALFDPLGLRDTTFFLPPEQQPRLAGYYEGADLADPMKPGLTRNDALPHSGAFVRPAPRLLPSSGLATSLQDMVRLVQALLPRQSPLSPAVREQALRNQLAPGLSIGFPTTGPVPGKGYGLVGAVTLRPTSIDPPRGTGEVQWGGLGGTHWWLLPEQGVAGVLMTQRHFGFWQPFSFQLKRLAVAAVLGD